MAHSDWHPDNVLLLQAMDGELAAGMTEAVRDHLYVCPACREQSEELEDTLGYVSVVLREEQERQLFALPSDRKDFRERLAAPYREWTHRSGATKQAERPAENAGFHRSWQTWFRSVYVSQDIMSPSSWLTSGFRRYRRYRFSVRDRRRPKRCSVSGKRRGG
jgi:anti-sigma factor RsiW